ncbi:MerR family transcriptional regulator [Listeria fleischmannii]|uniref:HTH-type transcriptional regulator GlnR n=2 Tax=Listeria fleischmannii TaxID=1069827 RepID=W7DBZ7_9LIST|nr:MerR family transcriptional regulator [Listeria fleischmannii]EIA20929.1 transcriptional repressor GlnR [Listeria fleischmannii subsp. coloradonensis]EUJ45021.1 HTH-type transcriptional regulator GlnR [Listeria fleischmannii FSL S10-1203]MBC1397444.1 MerR family transcriptional regulator [Listeria fleischmannii]MBC1418419.1 MerR family transcriptional regulator [Listeria fleischmannii]MBC1425813.1 MerR family transcriptional regulator [Listeria fleischmannii]
MSEKEIRRSMPLFPIGPVMKLTDLTARQIRYYEDQGLISPARNQGNHRHYSLQDIDTLLEIKDYLNDGLNIAGIKKMYQIQDQEKKNPLTDEDVRKILRKEMQQAGRFVKGDDLSQNQYPKL